jgi:hypothetical protein
MRVYLDERLFESEGVDPLGIIELIGHARDGRHRILLQPAFRDQDTQDLPRNKWMRGQEERLRRQLARLLETSASAASSGDPGAPRITVIDSEQSDWTAGRLAVLDALRLLRTPLKVLVENRRNDWLFLLAMVDEAHRRALRAAEQERWLEVDNGGGIDDLAKRLRDFCSSTTKDSAWHIERLRTWVMFDRDAAEEDPRQPSPVSRHLLDLCCEDVLQGPWPFPVLQLSRRTIESYLPLEALAARGSAKNGVDRLSALRRLRDEHPTEAFAYNMKEGFMKDARAIRKDKRGSLKQRWEATTLAEERHAQIPTNELPGAWCTLPTEIVADLLFGFGADVAKLFDRCDAEPRWEEQFQQEYDRGPPHQRSRTEIATQILELI